MSEESMFGPGFNQAEVAAPAEGELVPEPPREEFITKRELMPIRKNRGSDETQHTFSARVMVKASNTFVAFCNRRRLTYREGFDVVAEMLERLEREEGARQF
jgi:hypothetical protein